MTAENELQAAIQAARLGETERAYELFVAFTQKNPFSFQGYLWLSELAKTLEEQTFALERAQALCPPDPEGKRDLQSYLNELRGAILLPEPATPAPAPIFAQPAETLRAMIEPTDVALLHQTQRLNLFRNEEEPGQKVLYHSIYNLYWISAPSLLLLALLVFIQFEWNQFPTPLLVVLGLLSLLAGGLLVAASVRQTPVFQSLGWLSPIEPVDPILLQRRIRLTGWLLVILPFTIVLRAVLFAGLR